MKRFYSTKFTAGKAALTGSERDHCIKVLRCRIGDELEIVDGQGGLGRGRLIESNPQEAVVELIQSMKIQAPVVQPCIAIAIPKNPSRWDYLLEKATELGVGEIIPLICQRSEKKRIRLERNRQIILSAFKQSCRLYLPQIHEPAAFESVVEEKRFSGFEKFIAHCPEYVESGSDQNPHLGVLHNKNKASIILIGPEGDFTKEEISLALKNEFRTVSLGSNRLRVETAGIAACNIIKCIDQLK